MSLLTTSLLNELGHQGRSEKVSPDSDKAIMLINGETGSCINITTMTSNSNSSAATGKSSDSPSKLILLGGAAKRSLASSSNSASDAIRKAAKSVSPWLTAAYHTSGNLLINRPAAAPKGHVMVIEFERRDASTGHQPQSSIVYLERSSSTRSNVLSVIEKSI